MQRIQYYLRASLNTPTNLVFTIPRKHSVDQQGGKIKVQ